MNGFKTLAFTCDGGTRASDKKFLSQNSAKIWHHDCVYKLYIFLWHKKMLEWTFYFFYEILAALGEQIYLKVFLWRAYFFQQKPTNFVSRIGLVDRPLRGAPKNREVFQIRPFFFFFLLHCAIICTGLESQCLMYTTIFMVSLQLSASVERVSVSRMQDFFFNWDCFLLFI